MSNSKKLYEELNTCQKVKDTMNTPGWKVIESILDRMIVDVLGGKVGNEWKAGIIKEAKKDEERDYYIGYKQFGIDFHNRIYNHIVRMEALRQHISKIEEQEAKGETYVTPMEDTRYAV